MNKYTLIWSYYFQRGSHSHQITRMMRILKNPEHSWTDTLDKYNLEMSMVTHIFNGWPSLQSEPDEDIKESEPFVDNE